MAACEKAKSASAGDFQIHIQDLVSQIAQHVADKIQDAVQQAAEDIQGTIDNGDELSSAQQQEVNSWKKNLSVDLKSIDASSDDSLGSDVRSAVLKALNHLPEIAESFPDPTNTRNLMVAIEDGFAGKEESDGSLSAVSEESNHLRGVLSDWEGKHADKFKKDFLKRPDQEFTKKQSLEIQRLVYTLDLLYATVMQSREDLDSIAHAGEIAASNMIDNSCGDGTDGGSSGVTVTLVTPSIVENLGAGVGLENPIKSLIYEAGFVHCHHEELNSEPTLLEDRNFGAANWKELIGKIAGTADELRTSIEELCSRIYGVSYFLGRSLHNHRDDYTVQVSDS